MATYPPTFNLANSGNGGHILRGDCRLMGIGDSQSSIQPASLAQGWDSLFGGMMRVWSPTVWRGAMAHLQSDFSPNLLFVPTNDYVSVSYNGQQARYTTITSVSGAWENAATNIFPGMGQQFTLGTAANIQFYDARPNANLYDQFQGLLDFRVIFDGYANSGLAQLQIVQTGAASPTLTSSSFDTGATSGIHSFTLEQGAGGPAANTIRCIVRQALVDGDQTGSYIRFGGACIARHGVTTGLFLGAMSLGGTTTNYYAQNVAGGGMVNDDRFAAFLSEAYNTNHCFILIGQNDAGTLNKAAYKSALSTLINRCYAAMTTNGIPASDQRVTVVGLMDHGAITRANVEDYNEAAYELTQADVGIRNTAFISLDGLLGYTAIDASYIQSGAHVNQAGADYLAGLLQTAFLTAGGGGRTRPTRLDRLR